MENILDDSLNRAKYPFLTDLQARESANTNNVNQGVR